MSALHPIATLAGVVLMLVGAALPRRVAGTPARFSGALLIDLAMPALIFAVTAALSGRPIFAGIVTLSLGAGYAGADRSKRRTLREPIVFTDVFQAVDISRHPELALPFPHYGRILLGAGGVVAIYGGLYVLEPRHWNFGPWLAPALLAAALAFAWLIMRGPLRGANLRFLQSLGAIGDAHADAARLGPLAMLWVHALIAAGERAARRAALQPVARNAAVRGEEVDGPVVLVQCESFFDARRLHDSIDRNLLPNFDRVCAGSGHWGRLSVPSWGANTVRTEFAVLSGLPTSALGFDHFNPYHRFAHARIDTLAWRMRERGYRTICLHPFDGSFYGRNRIMPHLGFDEFIDETGFPADAQRVEGYITDTEVARLASQLLRERGPRLFLFVITMENHGPWHTTNGVCSLAPALADRLPAAEGHALSRYLKSLRNTDAMLGALHDTLQHEFHAGTLALYGDHLPSFPVAFETLGLVDRRSDYLIWRGGSKIARAATDLAAEELGSMIIDASRGASTIAAPP